MEQNQPYELDLNQLQQQARLQAEDLIPDANLSEEDFAVKCLLFFQEHKPPLVVSKLPNIARNEEGYLISIDKEGFDMTLEAGNKITRTTYNFRTGVIAVNHQPMHSDFSKEFMRRIFKVSKDIKTQKAVVYTK